jgi:hypothetical protein
MQEKPVTAWPQEEKPLQLTVHIKHSTDYVYVSFSHDPLIISLYMTYECTWHLSLILYVH